jgi:hypothetical protein
MSTVGDNTAHGGALVMGFPTVMIGEMGMGGAAAAGGGAGSGSGTASTTAQSPSSGPYPSAAQGKQSGSPAGGPPAKKTPTQAETLLANNDIKKGLSQAAKDSDIGGKNPTEQGGFILRDPKTGAISVEHLPAGKQAALSFPVSQDGTRNGKEIVGSFHTHPNVGPGWKQGPSSQDIKLMKKYPKTMGQDHFVVSDKKIYHIDNSGKVTTMGDRATLLK